MGVLNPSPKLESGEALLWKARANHVEGPGYTLYGMQAAAGGQLVVTDRRVFFQPSRADRAALAKPWGSPVKGVTGIEIVPPDSEIFAGGMRERLGIRTSDGVEVFVVNKLQQTADKLRGILGVS